MPSDHRIFIPGRTTRCSLPVDHDIDHRKAADHEGAPDGANGEPRHRRRQAPRCQLPDLGDRVVDRGAEVAIVDEPFGFLEVRTNVLADPSDVENA